MQYKESIELTSQQGRPTFHNVTRQVQEICRRSGIREGICIAATAHTTCSVILEEYSHDFEEDGLEFLQRDLCDMMETIAPACSGSGSYHHPGPKHVAFGLADVQPGAWSMMNTEAHLRSLLLGRSVILDLCGGRPDLGDFASVYFVDWDRLRGRTRRLTVRLVGE